MNGRRSMLALDKLNRISIMYDNYAYLLNSDSEWIEKDVVTIRHKWISLYI